MTARSMSPDAEKKIEELIKRYPQSKSAVMPALYLAQEELGSITAEAVNWISSRLNLPPAHIYEVATFYTMYYKKPVGKYHIQICRTLSCAICGAKKLTDYLKSSLKIKSGEITPDGMWSFEEVECLGSCGTAPMVQINDIFFENLDPVKLEAIIARINKEKPDLRYSNVRELIGDGFSDLPKSQVI